MMTWYTPGYRLYGYRTSTAVLRAVNGFWR